MKSAFVVTGTIQDASTVRLDQKLPDESRDARVRVVIQPLANESRPSFDEAVAELRARQQARGFKPPKSAEVEEYVRKERESWDS